MSPPPKSDFWKYEKRYFWSQTALFICLYVETPKKGLI